MRYDSFYPFQQAQASNQIPTAPRNFFSPRGNNPFGAFGQGQVPVQGPVPGQVPGQIPRPGPGLFGGLGPRAGLGGGPAPGEFPGAGPGAGLGGLAGGLGEAPLPAAPPSKIDSFLQSADKLFSTAQSYTPYIQQAAPMVKNIPSLWRMYKGFKGLPNAGAAAGSAASAAAPSVARSVTNTVADLTPRPSIPRIFQPPFNP